MSNDCCGCGHDHGCGAKSAKFKAFNRTRLIVGAAIFAFAFAFEQNWLAALLPPTPEYMLPLLCAISWLLIGGDVVFRALKNIGRGQLFDENFLMSIATIGAFAIKEYPEAAAVMLFYQIGEAFQEKAAGKSRDSIARLMDIRPDFARRLLDDGKEERLDPAAVQPGERIIVRPGERVPLDGIVEEGDSALDLAALSGEAVPRDVGPGNETLSGAVNTQGVLIIRVTKTAGESTASKILRLVEESAEKKSHIENFITKFARYYTPAVVGAAVLLALLPPLVSGTFDFSPWVYKALVFLVVSCPCALVLSIPLSFSGGLGAASRAGILIKGSNYLSALANVDTVVFDKTGTLTKGIFKVKNTFTRNGFDDKTLLRYAACAEANSNHPAALAIIKANNNEGGCLPPRSSPADAGLTLPPSAVTATEPIGEGSPLAETPANRNQAADAARFPSCTPPLAGLQEIAGHGVKALIDGKTVLAGNAKLMSREKIDFERCSEPGTIVYVAVDGAFAGAIVINDEIKPSAASAVSSLRELGVQTVAMFTGDTRLQAEVTARAAGITRVESELLPHEKSEKLEAIIKAKRTKGSVVFAGDGINDAPSLAIADIGVAMGGAGSDAAIEAADVVLMTDEPEKIAGGIRIARRTKTIVSQNITLALGVKGIILVLGALGLAPIWGAVFGDVGVALLAVLNSMRAMSLGRTLVKKSGENLISTKDNLQKIELGTNKNYNGLGVTPLLVRS